MAGTKEPSAGAEEEAVATDEIADGYIADAAVDDGETKDTPPEVMELSDLAEEAADDEASLAIVVRNVGRRIRLSPEDRDLLSDFEVIAAVCKALRQHEWRGSAMLAFCKIMPDVCRTSTVNRGSLRDEGFVDAVVDFLRSAVLAEDEPVAVVACTAISALCTASDGNKSAVARLRPEASVDVVDSSEASSDVANPAAKPNGILLLLETLGRFPDSVLLMTEAISALRSLLTDDDKRKASCEPAAVENREVALSDTGFPFFGTIVEQAFVVLEAAEKPMPKLIEQTLLLLKEIARGDDRIHALAYGAKLLPRVQKFLGADDARLVRGSLAVLRQFAFIEEVRDELVMMSDGAQHCLTAVRKNISIAAVCEQGFGLFANLTMRKGPAAAKLNEGDPGVVAIGLLVLRQHGDRPDVMRSVIHTLRNVASQEEAAAKEAKDSDVFEHVRKVVKDHEGDARWRAPVDIARQFLREFREDQGMEKAAQYNAYY